METENMETKRHIDLSYLAQVSGGCKDFELEMMQMFLDKTPEAISNLDNFINDKDWDRVRAIAHKTKSSVGIFGLNDIKESLFTIERNARELNDLETIRPLFDKTKVQLEEVMGELSEIVKEA